MADRRFHALDDSGAHVSTGEPFCSSSGGRPLYRVAVAALTACAEHLPLAPRCLQARPSPGTPERPSAERARFDPKRFASGDSGGLVRGPRVAQSDTGPPRPGRGFPGLIRGGLVSGLSRLRKAVAGGIATAGVFGVMGEKTDSSHNRWALTAGDWKNHGQSDGGSDRWSVPQCGQRASKGAIDWNLVL